MAIWLPSASLCSRNPLTVDMRTAFIQEALWLPEKNGSLSINHEVDFLCLACFEYPYTR